MPIMYIMRGVSGSGKSTAAQKLVGTIFSTDDYFMVKGKYLFDKRYLTTAHNKTQALVESWMMAYGDGNSGEWKQNIIIDNTNITKRDMEPYLVLAKKYNYEVKYAEPQNTLWQDFCNWRQQQPGLTQDDINALAEQLAARSVHQIPVYAIINQLRRWESIE
jgi:predicted kinase